MRRFSLRHLFLLTSFFCLWFGMFAYWRNVLVFVIPCYLGLDCLTLYLIHSLKGRFTRILFLTLLTAINIAAGIAAVEIGMWRYSETKEQIIWASYWEVVVLAGLTFYGGFHLINSDDRDSSFLLGILFILANFVIGGFMMLMFLGRSTLLL